MADTVPVKNQSSGGAPAGGGLQPLSSLRSQVDRLFEDFTRGFWDFPFGRGVTALTRDTVASELVPQIDVSETPDTFNVAAELPGLSEKDIEVTIADNVLTLRGEKKAEREEKKENYYLSERSFGSFSRSLRLPETVDQDKIAATFDKGVLKIALPKAETAKVREKKIEIKGR